MYNPKRTIIFIIISIILSSISITASAKDKENLAVNLGPIIKYESKDGKIFKARYGSLSDESIHFVKITMPDGNKYTLPQVLSGSGVRYTDEREIIWWTHQGTVRVDMRNDKGEWVTKYPELKEIK